MEKLFTVEEAARYLKIHSRTVRRYIKEGRLTASKVGGQWRITADQLETLTPGIKTAGKGGIGEYPDRVRFSSVIDIGNIGKENAWSLSNHLFAMLSSLKGDLGNSQCNFIYIEKEKTARFMLHCSLPVMKLVTENLEFLVKN